MLNQNITTVMLYQTFAKYQRMYGKKNSFTLTSLTDLSSQKFEICKRVKKSDSQCIYKRRYMQYNVFWRDYNGLYKFFFNKKLNLSQYFFIPWFL